MFVSSRGWVSPRVKADVITPGLIERAGTFGRASTPWTAPNVEDHARTESIDQFVVQVMSLDLLTTVVLQRIYVGVSITLATHLVAMAVLFLRGRLRFSGVRIALYWLFWGGALALQLISGNTFSPTSLLLGSVCYITFCAIVPASKQTHLEVIRTYQKIALVVSGIVFLDLVMQVAGLGMPDMNAVVPSGLTAPSMNYIQALTWHAGISKPNAFFMLEASFTSQFIAVGLIIELAFFQRWLWLTSFALALLGTFSGTGLMLVILALPVLARRFWRTLLLYGLILLPLLGGIAVATGWYEIASRRAASFDDRNSSAYQRFVGPFAAIYDGLASANEHNLIFGLGAGKTAVTEVVPGLEILEWNAISKVFVEYGIIISATFLVFITYCLFGTGVPFIIPYTMLLEYHFMGGYLTLPPIINYCFLLSAGWAIRAPITGRKVSL